MCNVLCSTALVLCACVLRSLTTCLPITLQSLGELAYPWCKYTAEGLVGQLTYTGVAMSTVMSLTPVLGVLSVTCTYTTVASQPCNMATSCESVDSGAMPETTPYTQLHSKPLTAH